MTRHIITVRNQADRDIAKHMVETAAFGSRMEFKQAKRTEAQNSKLWPMLADVAEQLPWHGVMLTEDDWKYLFLDALKREVRLVPNLDSNGFVSLGRSSSDLSISEMSDMIELIYAFGTKHGVKFSEPESNSFDATQANTDRTNAPAAQPSPALIAAGAHPIEASLLSDDWRSVYINTMANPTTRAMSIQTRDTTALQMIGGAPNEAEREWMRQVATLTNRRDKGKLKVGEFESEIENLKTTPLPAKEAA